MEKWKQILCLAETVILIFAIFLSCADIILYQMPNFFLREYEKYDVAEKVEMELDELLIVTEEMMSYLKGERDNLEVVTVIGGETKEFFNEREKAHMKDVQALFLKGFTLRSWAVFLFLVGEFLRWKYKIPFAELQKAMRKVVISVIVLFGGLGLYIYASFTDSFLLFHRLLFRNDYWMLNPATDNLIRILPEGFFADTAFFIGACFFSILILMLAIAFGKGRGTK